MNSTGTSTTTPSMIGGGSNASSFSDGSYVRPVAGFVICCILTRMLMIMKPLHDDGDVGAVMQASNFSLQEEEGATHANLLQRLLVHLPFQHYDQDNPQQDLQQQIVLLLLLLAATVYIFFHSGSTTTTSNITEEKTTAKSEEIPHKYVGLDPKRYNRNNDNGNDSDVFLSQDGEDPHTNLASNPNLWLIHGKEYDLNDFVNRHPGGKESILLGRGRDCTAMFDSYHAFTNQHRYVVIVLCLCVCVCVCVSALTSSHFFGLSQRYAESFSKSIKQRTMVYTTIKQQHML